MKSGREEYGTWSFLGAWRLTRGCAPSPFSLDLRDGMLCGAVVSTDGLRLLSQLLFGEDLGTLGNVFNIIPTRPLMKQVSRKMPAPPYPSSPDCNQETQWYEATY